MDLHSYVSVDINLKVECRDKPPRRKRGPRQNMANGWFTTSIRPESNSIPLTFTCILE